MAYNFQTGASGAMSGAATGASIGGPYGAAAGAVIGAAMGFFGDDAKEEALQQIDNWTPEMKELYAEMTGGLKGTYGQGINVLKQYLDPNSDVYKNLEAPYMRNFKEQIIPGIEEKYASMGGLSSSGFAQSLGSAAAGLQEKLAAMKQAMQYQSAKDIFGQYESALNKEPFSYLEPRQKEPGFMQQLIPQFANTVSSIYGNSGGGMSNQQAATNWLNR